MRSIFSLLAIGFFAFAFVSFAKYSDGIVLFRGFGYQVEFSLTVFVIFQIALIVFLYLSLRILSFVLSSKRRLLAYLKSRQGQREILKLRDAIKNLITAETSILYKQSKKDIQENTKVSKETLLIAAKAAHVEGYYSDRDSYITQLVELNEGDDVYLAQALMLIEEGRYHDTLAALHKMKKRSASSVRVELEASRLGRDWKQVLVLMKDIRKFDAISSDDCHRIELEAILGRLINRDMSLPEVKQVIKQASKRIRGEPSFVLTISKVFCSLGDTIAAQKIVEDYLHSAWDDDLVKHYAQVSVGQDSSALEKAEGWLVSQPRNPALLMGLGVMCRDRELWGKSESYFRACDALDASAEVAYELSKLFKMMNRLEESRVQLELFAVRQAMIFSKE
ncbi:MAG: hypothetical protein H2061_04655 [Burkholderiales bacterium]|nr:hypothetical protein [Burkholderiales bacterium]|tara:strand:- start:31505 stop:32683 length:1179 start_codon:yes stop_codon:yes gene_type:complete